MIAQDLQHFGSYRSSNSRLRSNGLSICNLSLLALLVVSQATSGFTQEDETRQGVVDRKKPAFREQALANGEYLLLTDQVTDSQDSSSLNLPSKIQRQDGGAAGGASMADFSQLMMLIQSTIDPDSWESGDATMMAYPGGIYIDAKGVVHRCLSRPGLLDSIEGGLSAKVSVKSKDDSPESLGDLSSGWNKDSSLRFISLRGLFSNLLARTDAGRLWDLEVATLAGLHRIDFILLDEENDDVVLAGPAGGGIVKRDGELVSLRSGTSPVLLADVISIGQALVVSRQQAVVCSLDPSPEGLARVHALLNKADSAATLLRNPKQGAAMLSRTLGGHRVSLQGLSPSSPTALALLQADIHMKRLGLGLEVAKDILESYPKLAEKSSTEPDQQLVRWWFTPDYPEILTNDRKSVFSLPDRRLKLQSEKQWMDAKGDRVMGAERDEAADRFATDFSKQIAEIQKAYPLYGRLGHIFDTAVAWKLASENCSWLNNDFIPELNMQSLKGVAGGTPKEVDSTAAMGTWKKGGKSYRWLMVSGGVDLDLRKVDIASKLKVSSSNETLKLEDNERPAGRFRDYWWWDGTSRMVKPAAGN
jgi:hypothetical protein